MRAIALLPFALLLAAPALASPDWSAAPRVDVALSSFSFEPKLIHLHSGQPVILHLANTGSGGHSFTAPEFFASAAQRAGPGTVVGGVEVSGHQARDIALVPRAGHYPLKCAHTLHKMMGMKGEIVVD